MQLGCVLAIVPDARVRPHYLREIAAEGYTVQVVSSLNDALAQLSTQSYDLIVFDIDEELPGTTIATIASIKPRFGAPLVILGSPVTLAQLLAEYSQKSADNSSPLDADALVLKGNDSTELRITVRDLMGGTRDSSQRRNSI